MWNNITNKRIDELDYIRGFALLGIILVNILALLHIKIPEPNTMDASYQRFLYLFVEGRFFSIFSFLFGVGFYIFITRAIAKGKNGYILFLRRVVALFIFGLIHQMFQPGEALTLYAICGLIVLPFYKAKKQINLVIGLILTIVFSIMGAKELLPLGLILLGLAAGQYKVFENLSAKIKQVAIFTGVMFVLSVVALWYQYGYVPADPFVNIILMNEDGTMDAAAQFLQIGVTVGPIISAFYVGALILLLQLKPVQILLAPLKYYGRMALTNYIGQTAMILIAGSVFNFAGNLTYMQTLYVCIAIYAIQIVFSVIWMKIFKMGPLEWIWRVITYWTVTPLKK
ncbi:DUF418 domain-containing protein [Bacillus mobilis]|uniref:DUF418 domain-containing protein n=1 Tax=Bacillus mobilis TaxID=2026190 RepID=UPI000BF96E9C|nr:DUF418 domain-containing protein [Bacillus mobilis]MED0937295.1 DUF418 domain-containing protein [Bacillus mobilis]PFS58393.1 hypothetical protein COK41_22615 [Bacillus cereus]